MGRRAAPTDGSVGSQALEAGQRKLDAASPLTPPIKPGIDRWGEIVVVLRELTGWSVDNSDGSPRTVHPSGRFYIVALTGDESVGTFEHSYPTPRNGLGKTLQVAIDEVPTTAPLFTLEGQPRDLNENQLPKLWLLLFSCRDGMIYSELSRPSARESDSVTAYHQRIQLPPLPYEGGSDSLTITPDDGPDTDSGPDIDVQPR